MRDKRCMEEVPQWGPGAKPRGRGWETSSQQMNKMYNVQILTLVVACLTHLWSSCNSQDGTG